MTHDRAHTEPHPSLSHALYCYAAIRLRPISMTAEWLEARAPDTMASTTNTSPAGRLPMHQHGPTSLVHPETLCWHCRTLYHGRVLPGRPGGQDTLYRRTRALSILGRPPGAAAGSSARSGPGHRRSHTPHRSPECRLYDYDGIPCRC